MKRWILGIAIVIIMAVVICLFMPVNQHSDFEGEWYSAGEGELYLFEDGIIDCQTHFYMESDEGNMSGAYAYAADKLAIFVRGIDELANVEELYLVQSNDGEVLNEAADGSGYTYFYRNQEAAVHAAD